jgi:sortase (surface protein transpeptidase)
VRSLTLRKVLVLAVMVGALVLPASSSSSPSSFRLSIPRIGLNVPLSYTTRDYGPQVYYQDFNTLMIAGHRVTHTHPFYYINELRVGDPIYVLYNGHRNKWIVKRHAIYTPIQARHLSWYPGLVLSACTPRHFATYRYVVFARPA